MKTKRATSYRRSIFPLVLAVSLVLGLPWLQADGIEKQSPNEAGKVMVLMYHGVAGWEGAWVRSRANFRKDLETLYEKGYRPVSLSDYVQNRIATEAGLSPVVLTFDDGRMDNFKVTEEDGRPAVDADSAVGILEAFHQEHPDFPLEATFFLARKSPFNQAEWIEYKLNYLISRGMDVGNHTANHANLALEKFSSPARIQRIIGEQARYLESKITEHRDYRVNTYALCHGGRPKGAALRKYLERGITDGYEYSNIAVLNVGSGPAPSPVVRDFNPMSIPRIRASDKVGKRGIAGWIKYFDKHPEERYVSDGDPKTVAVSKELSGKVDPSKLGGAELKLYDPYNELDEH